MNGAGLREDGRMAMDRIGRIERMEAALDACHRATAALEARLCEMDALKADMTALFQYYGSEAWYADRESPVPDGVRAGVLSEDLVYDEITAVREAAIHMLELATDILKNRI